MAVAVAVVAAVIVPIVVLFSFFSVENYYLVAAVHSVVEGCFLFVVFSRKFAGVSCVEFGSGESAGPAVVG